jgi:hypothetical protein
MDWGFSNETALGYARIAAGGADSALAVSSLTFGQAGSPGFPIGTKQLLIQPSIQACRWRDDGLAPTSTVGYLLPVGAELRYTANSLQNLQLCSSPAGAAIDVAAYGP